MRAPGAVVGRCCCCCCCCFGGGGAGCARFAFWGEVVRWSPFSSRGEMVRCSLAAVPLSAPPLVVRPGVLSWAPQACFGRDLRPSCRFLGPDPAFEAWARLALDSSLALGSAMRSRKLAPCRGVALFTVCCAAERSLLEERGARGLSTTDGDGDVVRGICTPKQAQNPQVDVGENHAVLSACSVSPNIVRHCVAHPKPRTA